jgi:hypothetical protein
MSTQGVERGSLFKGNAHTASTAITVFDAATGQYVPLQSASVTARISATPQGAALSGLGPLDCSEAPAGTYSATFDAASLAGLTDGATVYQVIAVGTSAVLTTPLLVRPARYVP